MVSDVAVNACSLNRLFAVRRDDVARGLHGIARDLGATDYIESIQVE